MPEEDCTLAQRGEIERNGPPRTGEMILEDGRRVPDPAFGAAWYYRQMSARLKELIDAGEGGTPEAGALHDEMEDTWDAMTPQEQDELRARG